jgi:Ni/Co efflux regulator RcnB
MRPGPRPEVSSPPPAALIIHRDQNGYTRHYVGSGGGALGGRPRRDPRGPAYLYHGRPYAPFRMARYHWPQGESYHRFHRHERFPRIFLISEYFIDNYTDYDLGAPPGNAQWVRYGDDLVLVDLDTGDILNVVTGAFLDSDDGTGEPSPEDGSPPPDGGPQDIGPPLDGATSPN